MVTLVIYYQLQKFGQEWTLKSNIIQFLPHVKAGSVIPKQFLTHVYLISHDKACPERLRNLVQCLNALVLSKLFS